MSKDKIPLKDHYDALLAQRDRTMIVGVLGMVCTAAAVIWGQEKATTVALAAATEKGIAHNGLIDRMREMARQYVTWPTVMLLLALAVTIAQLLWGK